jgi:glycosyltransferase involved in cell wall biosynthesis
VKILVLSHASFTGNAVRLGAQMLALEFAKLGHGVDYVGQLLNPLDFLASNRRERWRIAWGRKTAKLNIAPGLREFLFRAPFPRSRKYWTHPDQLRWYTALVPESFFETEYDLCVYDASFAALLRHRVRAKQFVFRINDNPEGFLFHMHPWVVEDFKDSLRCGDVADVWPVSEPLLAWAHGLNPGQPGEVIPNGLVLERYENLRETREPRTAVYVGKINEWFDVALLDGAACMLPEWTFYVYGPDPQKRLEQVRAPNIRILGPLPFERVPETLACFETGLIPFSGNEAFLNAFDPLKAGQYLAAGLGIASTGHGRLRTLLEGLAVFGNDPASFARAVEQAAAGRENPENLSRARAFAAGRDWKALAEKALSRAELIR